MTWARVANGLVAEVTDFDPAGRYHPSLLWVHCGAQIVQQGWSYDGDVFKPPIPAAQDLESVVALRLAAYRCESDPIKIEAEHDALLAGEAPNYSEWLSAVANIKERYPLPT